MPQRSPSEFRLRQPTASFESLHSCFSASECRSRGMALKRCSRQCCSFKQLNYECTRPLSRRPCLELPARIGLEVVLPASPIVPRSLRLLALLDDLFAVAAQEVIDGFHADTNRAGGFVFVQILEAEIRRARLLDDAFDNSVDRRVVAALKTRDFKRD